MNDLTLENLLSFVKERFSSDSSGHDYFHTLRVYKVALNLQKKEGGDIDIITYASLLHDVDDHKLFAGDNAAERYLDSVGVIGEAKRKILTIISEVSYKGVDSVSPRSVEGQIVQDADRLDAIGAIGVARAFAYGGSKNRVMHDPEVAPKLGMNKEETYSHVGTTINHFYEKLLLLEGMMNTKSAKDLAKERTAFMKRYLDEFFAEWDEIR
ncbi:MAG: HD domain-containing protein [Bacilli bacterium]|nr:HD domain-containing protein [Bacilli bacterium]